MGIRYISQSRFQGKGGYRRGEYGRGVEDIKWEWGSLKGRGDIEKSGDYRRGVGI